MKPGRLIVVVGPSGVGKDSVIAGIVAARPTIAPVRRTITRAPDLGGEDYTALSDLDFVAAAQAGAFCVQWQAHGLRYGIPAEVLAGVNAGQDYIANLSRAALSEAKTLFPDLVILSLTASPATLQHRLAMRDREDAADIKARLARAANALPTNIQAHEISNDGALTDTLAQALNALDPPAAASPKSPELCLANAQLVLSDRVMQGQIRIHNGRIAQLTPGRDVPAGALDCRGDYVLPGLVELHTDNLERHIEPRPTVDWPHLPALLAHDAELASTGITTVFDAMRAGSIHHEKSRYKAYARKLASELLAARDAGHFKISHFLHLRAEICSENLLDELAEFGPQDRVGILSLMDHTPGQRQFADLDALKTYIAKKRGMNDADFDAHVVRLQDLQKANGAAHEAGAVQEAKRLGAVLASHDDTTPAQVEISRQNGVGFAEFPTTLGAAQACRAHGIAVMMGAPNIIRGGSHSGNVSALDLARTGLLDIVSSDYVPSALLLAAFHLADLWGDLPRAIACVTANPARATGLGDRGRLVRGLRGDLVRVKLADQTPILRGVWSGGVQVA